MFNSKLGIFGRIIESGRLAADWHELVIPRLIMRLYIARDSEQLDQRCSMTDIPPHQSAALGFHPYAVSYYSLTDPVRMAG